MSCPPSWEVGCCNVIHSKRLRLRSKPSRLPPTIKSHAGALRVSGSCHNDPFNEVACRSFEKSPFEGVDFPTSRPPSWEAGYKTASPTNRQVTPRIFFARQLSGAVFFDLLAVDLEMAAMFALTAPVLTGAFAASYLQFVVGATVTNTSRCLPML
jgi:hypothetical protein